jgi:FkbM family methyltransferase
MLKKITKKILRKFHYRIVRIGGNDFHADSLLHTFYTVLKQINFEPKHIVDIGANHGTWTREALKHFPNAYYTLLEPQYWLEESIKDLLKKNNKIKFNAVGAGEKTGTFKFTILDKDHSSSFKYTEEEAKSGGFKQIELPVVTLNDLLANSNLPTPDIIKIDAEGLDIEVLRGASNFFGKTEIFMVEAGVAIKTFDNSAFEMMNFMDKNGYRLFDLTDLLRPLNTRVLWLVEMVFVKKGGIIDSHSFVS